MKNRLTAIIAPLLAVSLGATAFAQTTPQVPPQQQTPPEQQMPPQQQMPAQAPPTQPIQQQVADDAEITQVVQQGVIPTVSNHQQTRNSLTQRLNGNM